jgi:uncharacterized membrane-anchored protein YhcB (DUF1043 family)
MIFPEENKNKSRIYIALIVLLLISFGISLFFINKQSTTIEEMETELTDLEDATENQKEFLVSQYEDMVSLYDSLGEEYEFLKGINAELDSLLEKKGEENYLLRVEIDNLKSKDKLNAEEITKLQALIEEYKAQNEAFMQEIENLVAQNEALTESLEEERAKNEALTEQNEYLGGKYEMGSLLETQNLEIAGIKVKSSGKEVTTNNVKKLEQLRICFETGENKVIEAGEVEMYVRIIGPSGVTIAVESLGSGVFTNKDNGEEMQYTKAIAFDYEGANKRICVYWSDNIYDEGDYTVEIYQSGFLIGGGTVKLKSGLF